MSKRLLADVHARAGSSDATKLAAVSEICSAKEFDGDFRGGLGDRFLNLLGGPGQSIGVDIDPDVTPGTNHAFGCLEPSNRLFQFVPTLRTLEPNLVCVDLWH
jgi:hypothetical protein